MGYPIFIPFLLSFFITKAEAQELQMALIPIGEVELSHLQIAEEAVIAYYNADVHIPSETIALDTALLTRKNYGDQQMSMMVINAHATNTELLSLGDAKYDLIIGITDSALTIGKQYRPGMTIRGLADSDASVATISTHKLKQESANRDEFTVNLSKVVKHEIAHVLDLEHCEVSETCLMRNGFHFAKTTIDFCPACEEKIDQRYLKHDVRDQ
ncbi:hypothetical protein [Catalinimonas locisalis]|uniref:hypothetical protein n=1 Tax=Catalinimonas locisalis TaxID=3133978 RepID=UPI003101497D